MDKWGPIVLIGLGLFLAIFGITFISPSSQAATEQHMQHANNPQLESIYFGMGCFWGAEKRMAAVEGVVDVHSGYAGGDDVKAGYEDVLDLEKALKAGRSSKRNHAEVVRVIYDPKHADLSKIFIAFWENHNPTQGDRQGNDIGSNYRSAIYHTNDRQKALAEQTKQAYQKRLTEAGHGSITTEIAPLKNYNTAEEYHQNYLVKNPNGYCGLGGTGVQFAMDEGKEADSKPTPLDGASLNQGKQLVVYETEHCAYCDLFKKEILNDWQASVPYVTTMVLEAPQGWSLASRLFASPSIVLFDGGKEVARYTGYNGDKHKFWQWLGAQLLPPDAQHIAFEAGTERAFTGPYLDEKRTGTFIDPISGKPLFRSDTKFESGCGWPSFFDPMDGALTFHEDNSHGMQRIEVRSASSGIHLGHVFNDGPPPTGKRYCINGKVLTFVPDEE